MSQTTNSNPLDMNAMLTESLSKGIDAMGKQQYKDGEPDTAKFAGFIEMDKGFVELINTAFASFGHLVSKFLSPKVYETALKTGNRLNTKFGGGISETNLQRTAAGITLGVNLSIFLGESASKLWHDVRDQHDARTQMNREVRGVYDRASDGKSNTVLMAHRRRMSKEASVTNINTVLMGLGPNILNLIGEATNAEALMTGVHRDIIYQQKNAELVERLTHEINASRQNPLQGRSLDAEIRRRIDKENNGGMLFGFAGGGMLLSKLFKAQADSSKRRLDHHRQPYSAYEMIVGLYQQMSNGAIKGGRYALPGRRGGELSLEQYVAAILDLHAKERPDFDKNAVEIRPTLKEDVHAVSKAIAERLEKGDIDAMQLIRLVGEGKIVKNGGRAIASEDEVNEIIDTMVGTKAHAMQGDAKEYLAARPFTEQTLKDDFKHLEGEERIFLAASIPDAVLRKIGFKDDEIKQVQQYRASEAFKMMTAAVAIGMQTQGDRKLHDGGLGITQVKQVHKAAEAIQTEGVDAVDKLKTSATHPDGIEHVIADYAVNELPKNKVLISTLANEGKQVLEEGRAANDNPEATRKHSSHVEKHFGRGHDAPNGHNDNGFAEALAREAGQHGVRRP